MHRVRAAPRLLAHAPPALPRRPLPPNALPPLPAPAARRTFLNLFKRGADPKKKAERPPPLLAQDDLFHPFSRSPFAPVRARGDAIQSLAPCPVCASEHAPDAGAAEDEAAGAAAHAHVHAQPRAVAFECPDCGWPTHCSHEHWLADEDHKRYCGRLREANEDEHDLRSGRRLREFELPGPQDMEAAVSFANWDVFWYTREFPSMDTERARRHASKLLTFPITVGSVLHQYSGLTVQNQRLTPEGARSLAALRSTLHAPPGAPETEEQGVSKPTARVFILGARAESSLPPHVWEQLTMLFPAAHVHIFFIGPQVSLPIMAEKPAAAAAAAAAADTPAAPADPASVGPATAAEAASPSAAVPDKPTYLPNVYEPATPAPIPRLQRTRSSVGAYGVPSYTIPYARALTVTGLQASYMDVHAQFQDTYDPFTDAFFLFSPGLGFPSPTSVAPDTGAPLLQIASPTEWGPVLPTLLASQCPIFVTGFSPADVERDVKSLSTAPGVAGEFDWVLTPGPNAFGSEKWEVADFDPRVMVKTNWGIWGIRGKSRDVQPRGAFSSIFG